MAFSLSTVFSAVDKFTAPLKRMEAANQKFAASSSKAFEGMNDKIFSVRGQLLNLAGGVSIATLAFMGFDAIKQYDSALASLSSITGITGDAFIPFKAQVMDVAKRTKESAIDVAKAFELVGSAKSELLSDAKALGVVSEAAITLSKSSGVDLESSTLSLVGVLNQFNLKADQSARVINALAAGSIVGAATTAQVNDSIRAFGTGAEMMNVSLEQSVALTEILSQKQIVGAEAGTKLRNILSKMAAAKGLPKEAVEQMKRMGINIDLVSNKAIPFEKRLQEMAKVVKDPVAMLKIFGEENKEAAAVILSNTELFGKWTKEVTGTNAAYDQANIRSKSLAVRMTELKNKFINFAISSGEASGTASKFGKVIGFITDHLDSILDILVKSITVYVAYRAIVGTLTAAQWLYNTALGVYYAFQKSAPLTIGKSAAALKSYAIGTKIATAAQWAFNVAAAANPIGLIVTAIILAIAAIVIMVMKWKELVKWYNEQGTAMKVIIGLLAITQSGMIMLAYIIRKVIDAWQTLSAAFDKGFLEGIKTIGKFILSFILKPVEILLKIISKITGAKWANSATEAIEKMRADLEAAPAEEQKPVNTVAAANGVQTQRYEEIKNQKVEIALSNKTDKNATVKSNPAMLPVITNTY